MKIGIAGAGSIVPTFLESQVKVEGLTPYAICASRRSKEKMECFAAQYGIERIYYSYQEMIADEALEGVYVAVPNHLHYEFTKLALERGLHVICEKPFCANANQLKELIALAEQKQLFLFEAISNQYFPNYQRVKELIPELGRLRLVTMNFSQYSSRYDAFLQGKIAPAFDPKQNGGALMDLNVYNIHFVVGLFGEPEKVQYFPNIQRGIDTSGVLVLCYEDFTCTLTAAKDCGAPLRITIQGDKGCIMSDCAPNSFEAFSFRKNGADVTEFVLNTHTERLYYELDAFAAMVREGSWTWCQRQLEQSLTVQKILDKAREISDLA